MVDELVSGTEYEAGVRELQEEAATATAIERQGSEREKHGAPTGRFAINPVNGQPCTHLGRRLRAHGLRYGCGHGSTLRRPA
jgi:leucyl-tRNA synthetase